VPTVLEQLADLAAGVRADALPDSVAHEARRRLLDALGCMLGGAAGQPLRSVYDAVGATLGPATLIGDRRRASVADAALANCTALRYLDYMDGHPGPYPCHPSLVIPPVLAVAESQRSSGMDVIRAIAIGYEVDIRLQLGSGDPDITAHGWSGSTNLGIAIPAAIGGLLDMSAKQLAHALAISTVHCPTLDATGRGQMAASKSCVDGIVALTSVSATLMARFGMTGKLTAYEGDDGFVAAVSRRFDDHLLLEPIKRFRILDAYTKQFNAVKCAQSAVTSALRLRRHIESGDSVASVILRFAERDARNQRHDVEARRRPGNRDTANHSAVYCVAAALVEGGLGARQFDDRSLSDPRIHAIIDRTEIEADPSLSAHWPQANPATVEIRTTAGRLLTNTTIHFPGHPNNPIADADLDEKFRSLATPALGLTNADTIIDVVSDLASCDDITALTGLLVPTTDRSTA
jgi:2-methylcitrate dehydratase